jgi:hypothetical protein
MDANYFREKAETCRRLANDLRWNNPERFHLMDLAEDFQKRAEQQPALDDPVFLSAYRGRKRGRA